MWSRRSYLPRLLGNDYWDMFDYPSSIFDQDFGLGALDYGGGYGGRGGYGGNQLMPFNYGNQNYPLQGRQGFSNVQNDQNKFAVNLDCKQFKPEEVNVTVDDQNNQLLVQGKHEERSDEHGHISREFKRRYAIPKESQLDKINCNWNNGVLCIEVPKQPQQPQITDQGRCIPISTSGQQQGQLQGQQSQQTQLGQQQPQDQQQIPVHHQQDAKQDIKQSHPTQTATRG